MNAAFQPLGPIVGFTADTSAPTAQQAGVTGDVRGPQVMLTNTSSTVDVVVGWGSDSPGAKAAAASTTSESQYYLLRGSQVVISVGSGAYFTGITSSSTAVVKVQAGVGL
jgi:hypothetical protein